MACQSINPNDGKLLMSFQHMASAELETALDAEDRFCKSWKHTRYAERAALLNKAASLLRQRSDDFAKLATLEMGKRIAEARGEVMVSAAMFVNNLDWSDADPPFGGIKASGYGRELGQMGIHEFVNKKLIRKATLAAPAS